jgi:uncharacterized membrane protein
MPVDRVVLGRPAGAGDGGIRVDVTLSSNPAYRAGRQAVAGLLGVDPKQQLDRDLLRM